MRRTAHAPWPLRPARSVPAGRRPAVLQAVALALALALLPLHSALAAAEAGEYQVKAAFVVKFGAYVEWPAQAFERPDSPFVIGVVASEAVALEVERAAAGQLVEGRPVQVRRLERGTLPAPGAEGALHAVFIARSHNGHLAETLSQARGRALLTVTEAEHALALGSVINFVLVDNKVRFDIALAPAEAGHLRISARLLTVARRVLKG